MNGCAKPCVGIWNTVVTDSNPALPKVTLGVRFFRWGPPGRWEGSAAPRPPLHSGACGQPSRRRLLLQHGRLPDLPAGLLLPVYLLNNRHLSLPALEAGSVTSGCQHGPARTFIRVRGVPLYPHVVKRGRVLFYNSTNPIQEDSILTI